MEEEKTIIIEKKKDPSKIIVESEVKRTLRDKNMNKEEDYTLQLEKVVRKEIEKSIIRAKLNGRKTVMVRDL